MKVLLVFAILMVVCFIITVSVGASEDGTENYRVVYNDEYFMMGDYEYSAQTADEPYSIHIYDDGRVRFEHHDWDKWKFGERAELSGSKNWTTGSDVWVSFTWWLDEESDDVTGPWNVFHQMHPQSGSPLVALESDGETLKFITRYNPARAAKTRWEIKMPEKGKRFDFVYRVVFGGAGESEFDLWVNGKQEVSLTNITIDPVGGQPYVKYGIYRARYCMNDLITWVKDFKVSPEPLLPKEQ